MSEPKDKEKTDIQSEKELQMIVKTTKTSIPVKKNASLCYSF